MASPTRACDDIAHGQEAVPIPWSPLSTPPPRFQYAPRSVLPAGLEESCTRLDGPGCACLGACEDGCPCAQADRAEHGWHRECGDSCGCSAESCGRRTSQRGVSVRLVLRHAASNKGWGVFARERIAAGRFVCEYTGELLTNQVARERQALYDLRSHNFLLVVRAFLPSGTACVRVNIDATTQGNVGRFFNHACDGGNLRVSLLQATGSALLRVAFFARRGIQDGEELTFSYGSSPPAAPEPPEPDLPAQREEHRDSTPAHAKRRRDADSAPADEPIGRDEVEAPSPRKKARQLPAQPRLRRCFCSTGSCSGWLPFDP